MEKIKKFLVLVVWLSPYLPHCQNSSSKRDLDQHTVRPNLPHSHHLLETFFVFLNTTYLLLVLSESKVLVLRMFWQESFMYMHNFSLYLCKYTKSKQLDYSWCSNVLQSIQICSLTARPKNSEHHYKAVSDDFRQRKLKIQFKKFKL